MISPLLLYIGILAPGRMFGHEGGHFGMRVHIWAREWAIWCAGARLGMRAGILALGRAFILFFLFFLRRFFEI